MEAETPNLAMPRLDRWGIVVSAACLVHCLALPLLTAALPLLALAPGQTRWVHPVLLVLALNVTGLALWQGYRRHRRVRPALVGAPGIAAIAAALWAGERAETILTVAGVALVGAAHWLNWGGHSAGRHR